MRKLNFVRGGFAPCRRLGLFETLFEHALVIFEDFEYEGSNVEQLLIDDSLTFSMKMDCLASQGRAGSAEDSQF